MIFVILGTQKIPFTRLLEAVDDLIEREGITEEVVAQSGHTQYQARNFRCIPFLSESEFQSYIERASVVITHSGSGSIFSAMAQNKKIIAVARLHKYGEMVDDHQTELVRKLSEEGCILDGTRSLQEVWSRLGSFTPRSGTMTCTVSETIAGMAPAGGKVMFVCNKGGHYSEMMCLHSLKDTFDLWMLSDNRAASDDFGDKFVFMDAFNYSSRRKLKFISNLFQAVGICITIRPCAIISTGAGIAVPVFLAARLFGIKLVFIESRARVYSKSRAGRLLAHICDSLIVQWPEMVDVYGKKAECYGTLI